MAKRQRRKFSVDFKLKVIQEALQERLTLRQLSEKYELHPNQISNWKQEFLEKARTIMAAKTERQQGQDRAAELKSLYAKIGQLQSENDFLKKKLFE